MSDYMGDSIKAFEKYKSVLIQRQVAQEAGLDDPVEGMADMKALLANTQAAQTPVAPQYRPGVMGGLGAALQGTDQALGRMKSTIETSANQRRMTQESNTREKAFARRERGQISRDMVQLRQQAEANRKRDLQATEDALAQTTLQIGSLKDQDAAQARQAQEQARERAVAAQEKAQARLDQDTAVAQALGLNDAMAAAGEDGYVPVDPVTKLPHDALMPFIAQGDDGLWMVTDPEGLRKRGRALASHFMRIRPTSSFLAGFSDGKGGSLGGGLDLFEDPAEVTGATDQKSLSDLSEEWMNYLDTETAAINSGRLERMRASFPDKVSDKDFDRYVVPLLNSEGKLDAAPEDDITWWLTHNMVPPGASSGALDQFLVKNGYATEQQMSGILGGVTNQVPDVSKLPTGGRLTRDGEGYTYDLAEQADRVAMAQLPQSAMEYALGNFGNNQRTAQNIFEQVDEKTTQLKEQFDSFDKVMSLLGTQVNPVFQNDVATMEENPNWYPPKVAPEIMGGQQPPSVFSGGQGPINASEPMEPLGALPEVGLPPSPQYNTPLIPDRAASSRVSSLAPDTSQKFRRKSANIVARRLNSKAVQKSVQAGKGLGLTNRQLKLLAGDVINGQLSINDMIAAGIPKEHVKLLMDYLETRFAR